MFNKLNWKLMDRKGPLHKQCTKDHHRITNKQCNQLEMERNRKKEYLTFLPMIRKDVTELHTAIDN